MTYVDPRVVFLVVLTSISVPIRMAGQALRELLNRTPAPDIVERVRSVVSDQVSALPVMELFVRVVQPGRTRMVMAHVVLPADHKIRVLAQLDRVRSKTREALRTDHADAILDMVFTADWTSGAPSVSGK